MIDRLRLAAAPILVFLLAACAGPVPKIDASASKLSALKSISVVRPPEPKTYTVMNFGHPGMAFGLIGGVIAAADQNSKQGQLSAAFKGQHVAFSANLADCIVAKLVASGFEARVEDASWEEVDGKYKLNIEKINSTADGLMFISPTIVGFIATGATSDYLPTMTAVITLFGKDRKEVLYRGFHSYGWAPKADGWRATPAKSTFSNFDVLMSDTRNSAAALNDAGPAIAESLDADLRR